MFDMSSYVSLSDMSDVFTPTDRNAYKRSIDITLQFGTGVSFSNMPDADVPLLVMYPHALVS